eukprot:3732283-Alexandrium_andersonii.AAC.1
MSASLVGSEMCIRDSRRAILDMCSASKLLSLWPAGSSSSGRWCSSSGGCCLLYTSDAADDM